MQAWVPENHQRQDGALQNLEWSPLLVAARSRAQPGLEESQSPGLPQLSRGGHEDRRRQLRGPCERGSRSGSVIDSAPFKPVESSTSAAPGSRLSVRDLSAPRALPRTGSQIEFQLQLQLQFQLVSCKHRPARLGWSRIQYGLRRVELGPEVPVPAHACSESFPGCGSVAERRARRAGRAWQAGLRSTVAKVLAPCSRAGDEQCDDAL